MINISQIIAENSEYIGQDLWIADVNTFSERYKIIEPTLARLFSSEDTYKKLYNSNTFFRPYSKIDQEKLLQKVIPIFDNTGFKKSSGKIISVFKTEAEARAWFNKKMIKLIESIESDFERVAELHEKEIERCRKMIII